MHSLAFSFCAINLFFFSAFVSLKGLTILQFGDSLAQSLLLSIPSEKLESAVRQKPASHSKRKLAYHKFEEKKEVA
jgi:hypothetical protein